MVLGRAGRDLGVDRALDSLTSNELRAWLLTLRETLSPISVAGYVRGLKAFGRWCATEEIGKAAALRALRRPRVPHKLVEPLDDAALRRMLDAASVRDRAIVLLMLDTGLRLSELAGLRPSDLRPDGSLKVMGKGARERIVPVGGVARQALVRYLRQGNFADAGAAVFRGRGGGALGARGVQQVFKRLRLGHESRAAAARIFCVTPSPTPTSSTVAMRSACSGCSAIRRSTWSSATWRWRTPTWPLGMRSHRPPTGSLPPRPEPPR
jgi:site-specific recombinase XerC